MPKGKEQSSELGITVDNVIDVDSSNVSVSFDYSALPDKDRLFIQESVREINSLLKITAESIFKIGKYLVEVKDILPHGEYDRWIESEFPDWNRSTTKMWVQVY